MKNIIEMLHRAVRREAWTAYDRKKGKNPWNAREFMWRAIRLYATRASMPSWGLPFEAVAASALLKDRDKTLAEVHRCTRDGIRINTFMLDASSGLRRFVERMTQMNRGRAFFTTPETLGDYVLVDFVEQKRRMRRTG